MRFLFLFPSFSSPLFPPPQHAPLTLPPPSSLSTPTLYPPSPCSLSSTFFTFFFRWSLPHNFRRISLPARPPVFFPSLFLRINPVRAPSFPPLIWFAVAQARLLCFSLIKHSPPPCAPLGSPPPASSIPLPLLAFHALQFQEPPFSLSPFRLQFPTHRTPPVNFHSPCSFHLFFPCLTSPYAPFFFWTFFFFPLCRLVFSFAPTVSY